MALHTREEVGQIVGLSQWFKQKKVKLFGFQGSSQGQLQGLFEVDGQIV